MLLQATDAPPIDDARELHRMEHQRLRWRLMYGLAEDDIADRLVEALGNIRKHLMGPVDLTSNPFLHVWSQAAALYNVEPMVIPPEGAELTAAAVSDSGWWQLMQRVQRDALALRTLPVHIDVDEGEPIARPVEPYLVQVQSDPRRPARALAVTWWHRDPDDDTRWVRRIYDPRTETYQALDQEGQDVSQRVLGATGWPDAWRWSDGMAFLPWVIYRAAESPDFWDCYTGREVVEGTLQLGVLLSYYSHLVRNASWSQKYTVNANVRGADSDDGSTTRRVKADPASVLQFEQDSEAVGQVLIGQWAPSGDPEKILASIMRYERRLVDMAIGSAQVSQATSDIRSGYSLAVSREAQRELQRSYAPVFRRADLDALAKFAAMRGEPSDGWRIEHRAIPRDPMEQRAELDRLQQAIEQGLLDKVSAYMQLHPALTREEAAAKVAEIARINAGTTEEETDGRRDDNPAT